MVDQFAGQILASKYRMDSFLRADDLGAVYRGTHVSMDKPVTVKILSPALAVDDSIVERFSSEARAVSRFSHPNILNVTDFGSDKGTVYIVYEGAEGETLKNAIRTQGRFSIDRAVNITRQIAAALSAAHAAGEIHRNLSSDNILLTATPDGAESVKVMNLGSTESGDRFEIDDERGISAAEYVSPEQISGVDTVDHRCDIYSLGVIFYEMLAGEVPFTGARATEVMFKHAQEPPPPLSAFRQDLPPEIEPLVLQAMAKNPEMRFQTAQEFAFALARVSQNYGEAETVVAARAAAAGEPANNIWKTAFVVLAGISLLAIGMIYATSVKQTNPTTQLQTDANGQPVQPINPATGIDEQSLSNLATMPAEIIGIGNSNMMMAQPPGTLPGGDNYNPWGGSGPPPGAPPTQYVAPGGQVYTIDPNNPSQFIPQDGNIILVPLPANTSVNANVKPSPTPRSSNTNANVAPPPASNTAPKPAPETKPTAVPPPMEKPPTKTPAKTPDPPKNSSPAATEKRVQSGKLQDSL